MKTVLSEASSELPLNHYSLSSRIIESLSLTAFLILTGFIVAKIDFSEISPLHIVGLYIAAALSADFLSGFVHWFADTWGSYTWPVLGPTLIRSFREHHVDPKSITLHDFVETNGATAMLLVPILGLLYLKAPSYPSLTLFSLITAWLLFLTNQFHKWAHENTQIKVIVWLQRTKIILSVPAHQTHHHGDHTRGYCITTGWMNPVLNRIGFFRKLERLITALSGAQPRAEDLKLLGLKG